MCVSSRVRVCVCMFFGFIVTETPSRNRIGLGFNDFCDFLWLVGLFILIIFP